jgi:hypothetical protein
VKQEMTLSYDPHSSLLYVETNVPVQNKDIAVCDVNGQTKKYASNGTTIFKNSLINLMLYAKYLDIKNK